MFSTRDLRTLWPEDKVNGSNGLDLELQTGASCGLITACDKCIALD